MKPDVCRHSHLVASNLGICGDCVKAHPGEAEQAAAELRARIRPRFGLPSAPPRSDGGIRCTLCGQGCTMAEGERGFCGLRQVERGRLRHHAGVAGKGMLRWYRDPLPTNCVADWVCRGSGMAGFHNLAVFYGSCSFDCLFCQNWHFREMDPAGESFCTARELAGSATEATFCVCFFGGDPSSQMPHALSAARLLAARGVAICWETAGAIHPRLLDRALDLSLRTGGCMKFDIKAADGRLHRVLTGASNDLTLENLSRASRRIRERADPPLVVASTLLVPGYVGPGEVGRIARLIADLDPAIPYALLGFHPDYLFGDLPRTSVRHAEDALAAAHDAGLRNVRIGNRHLLGREY